MNTEQQIQSLQTQIEQLRMKVEELAKIAGKEPPGGPPSIVNELIQRLDKTKELDIGIIIGSVWQTKGGAASSYMSTAAGVFESLIEAPDAYVAKIVQPFCNPKSLAILKLFLDGAEKSKEDLQEVSGVEEEELDKLLMTLMELRYIKCETKQSVKRGSVIKKDVFSLDHHGRDLPLALLWKADEQRKYEEEGED